jgi:POT family proton-dependent oligopeptide transporter
MQQVQTLEQIQDFKGKYPKQLWYLFFSEMWERFSFYGMRGMLVYFMVYEMMMKEDVAQLQYGATQAFVYAFTFIGGLFADKILGFRKSLFWGGLLMIIGSCILAFDPKNYFFMGIGFTIIGTGFFKPNISTMVGSLYKKGDPRTDAGFSLFYSGVNLGALLGGYACIWLGKNYSWHLAFGLAAIVMTISLITFIFTQKSMGSIGLSPLEKEGKEDATPWYKYSAIRWKEYLTYIGSILVIPFVIILVSNPQYTDIFMYIIGPVSLVYLLYEMRSFSLAENKKLIAALVFIIFSIFFWAFFEQSGGSLSLFAANNLTNTVAGIPLDANGVNNSANSLFVIAFAALVGMVWLWMNKRKIEPNTLVKFGLGFLFLAGGFYIFYYTKFFADASGRTSLDLFTFGWFIITFGELCLSPIGMSVMTKLSPQKTQAVMMGMWFLASAYGQYFAGILGANISTASENSTNLEKLIIFADGYKQLAIYALIAGLVMIAISPLVRKLMQEVK